MSQNILTEDELSEISDARSRRSMIAWLESNKIPYLLARSGWPRVHRKAIERAMGAATEEAAAKEVTFNFDGLR